MKSKSISTVFSVMILLIVTAASDSSHAESFRVLKAKGRRAMIELPEGSQVTKGETYQFSSGDGGGEDSSRSFASTSRSRGATSRQYLIGFSGEISQLERSPGSTDLSTFLIEGRFGWNMEKFEAGPLATLSMVSEGDTDTNTISVGGFFDYNFVPNTVSETFVPGVGVQLKLGQRTVKHPNRSSEDHTTMGIQFGPHLKWFFGGTQTCARADLLYSYDKSSNDNAPDTKISGLKIMAGLQSYFW